MRFDALENLAKKVSTLDIDELNYVMDKIEKAKDIKIEFRTR